MPPIRTSYDGTPSGEPDPIDKMLAESVNRLLKTVDFTPDDRLEILIRLLEQRKHWIQAELSVERMLSPSTLPPTSFDVFSLEYLLEPESSVTAGYVRLLNRVDEAIDRLKRRIAVRNQEFASSDSVDGRGNGQA